MRTEIKNKKVEHYFQCMRNWDNESKKKLIIKLTRSIDNSAKKGRDFSSCFGAWIDDRSADEIADDLRADRVNNRETEGF